MGETLPGPVKPPPCNFLQLLGRKLTLFVGWVVWLDGCFKACLLYKTCPSLATHPAILGFMAVRWPSEGIFLKGNHSYLMPMLLGTLVFSCVLALHTFQNQWRRSDGIPESPWQGDFSFLKVVFKLVKAKCVYMPIVIHNLPYCTRLGMALLPFLFANR